MRDEAAAGALWREALPVGADGWQADAVLSWLLAQYTQPFRAYHTIGHIERMFAVWKEEAASVDVADRHALALGIWFHDAVYDPRRQDNEERSAEEAAARLAPLGIGEEMMVRIRRMILATAAHEASGADTDTALLLDLDLAILGAEPAEYDAYARAIRQEYAFVPEAEYRVGRGRVLRGFLDRTRIYVTAPMFARFEAQARCNLSREIAALDASAG